MFSRPPQWRRLWFLIQITCALLMGTHAADGQQRLALLIASGACDPASPLAHSFVPLAAPPNDVRLMAQLLEGRYGFRRPDIAIIGLDAVHRQQMGQGYCYLSDQARRDTILTAVGRLKSSRPDDYVVVYYSGHGAPLFDPFEGIDTGVLVTYEGTPQAAIRRKELEQQLDALASHHITLILDACFSGLFAKPAPHRLHGLEELKDLPDLIVQEISKSLAIGSSSHPEHPHRPPYTEIPISNSEHRFTTLAACGDNEETNEADLSGAGQSIAVSEFTWAFYRTLWQSQRITALEDLHMALMQRLITRQQHQTPLFRRGRQRSELIAPPYWLSSTLRLPLVSPGASTLAVGRFAGVSRSMQFQEEGSRPGLAAPHSTVRQVDALHWFDTALTSGHWQQQPRFVTPTVREKAPTDAER